ncbi:MAG: hypothetical protein DMG97_37810 [Acidobacteria bacterium]|nr:MAG: hypothetical protein DMG97_37810 [Acidobacteriota bacterium]
MAILAVLVAAASLLGHRSHTEEVVLQNKVTDQWAYYQAKNIRRHTDELFADFASVITASDPQKAAQLREKYRTEADRYRDEQKDIDSEAKKLEQETTLERRCADRYDLGEVFLDSDLDHAALGAENFLALRNCARLGWNRGREHGSVAPLNTLLRT